VGDALNYFLKEFIRRGQDDWIVISGSALLLEGAAKAE
jgi:hypothetical protein